MNTASMLPVLPAVSCARAAVPAPGGLRALGRALGLCLALAWLAAESAPAPTETDPIQDDPLPHAQQDRIRIGISPGTWGGVNRADATAAIRAWARIIMQQRGVALEVDTTLYESSAEMQAELAAGRVDAMSLLTDQFFDLETSLRPETVYFTSRSGSPTERYVVLVHRGSGIETLEGLKGRGLLIQNNARAGLANPWLETLLARKNVSSPTNFFASVTRMDNPSKVVLQAFFRKVDGCVVTADVFALAGELNPQIKRDLKILETSPEVIPALFYFCPGHTSRTRECLEPAMLALHESPAGQQVLTVFQAERMLKQPASVLASTQALLEEHRRLRASIQGMEAGGR